MPPFEDASRPWLPFSPYDKTSAYINPNGGRNLNVSDDPWMGGKGIEPVRADGMESPGAAMYSGGPPSEPIIPGVTRLDPRNVAHHFPDQVAPAALAADVSTFASLCCTGSDQGARWS